MALKAMGYVATEVVGDVEILYHADFVGEAVTLDADAFTDHVCLAGTPMAADGKVATQTEAGVDTPATSDAIGILLHDVYDTRPQGTIVIAGHINQAVAEEHSDVEYSDETIANLKLIAMH